MNADAVWLLALVVLVAAAVMMIARHGRMKGRRNEGGRDDHAANAGSWFGFDRDRHKSGGYDGDGNGGGGGGD